MSLSLKVFPIDIPEALTVITVWKRYNDIKALLKFIKKRHKTEGLSGIVPTLSNHTFFKRFEADVITERKLFIIRLLDFIGQHSVLYKSKLFQDFFATSQSMPKEEVLLFEPDDISSAVDTVDGVAANITNCDPSGAETTPVPSTSSSMNESSESSSSMSTPIIDSPTGHSDDEGYKASSENDFIINDSIKINPYSSDRSAAVLTRQYSGYFGLELFLFSYLPYKVSIIIILIQFDNNFCY